MTEINKGKIQISKKENRSYRSNKDGNLRLWWGLRTITNTLWLYNDGYIRAWYNDEEGTRMMLEWIIKLVPEIYEHGKGYGKTRIIWAWTFNTITETLRGLKYGKKTKMSSKRHYYYIR